MKYSLKASVELQSVVIILCGLIMAENLFCFVFRSRFIVHTCLSLHCLLEHGDARELLPLSPHALDSSLDSLGRLLPLPRDPTSEERPKRTGADYRALWKTAIHQQILLLRMEKENQRLEGESLLVHIN